MNFSWFIDIFFPYRCVACGTGDGAHSACCTACFKKISLNKTLFCIICDAPLPGREEICSRHRGNIPYTLGAAVNYKNGIAQSLIHQLKFNFIKSAAEPLGKLLAEYVCDLHLDIAGAVVVPIPLSVRRERMRGFNQSALIAQHFAAQLDLNYNPKLLSRVRHAKPQSETTGVAERRENIHGCFAAKSVPPKFIILIDDVVTSGSTLREATGILRVAGAEKIIALAVARA